MANRHHVRHSQPSAEVARSPFSAKTIFDKTKLSVVVAALKTTTNGINRPFRLNSMSPNYAIAALIFEPQGYMKGCARLGRANEPSRGVK
jgi:hypothetical protein